MPEIDNMTIMMSIQAVNAEIKKYEHLLTSETLSDPEEIQSLIFSYEKTAASLKEAYISGWEEGTNLPEYHTLIKG